MFIKHLRLRDRMMIAVGCIELELCRHDIIFCLAEFETTHHSGIRTTTILSFRARMFSIEKPSDFIRLRITSGVASDSVFSINYNQKIDNTSNNTYITMICRDQRDLGACADY